MTRRSWSARVVPLALLAVTSMSVWAQGSAPATSAKLHPLLLQRLATEPGPAKAWVFFTDKGLSTAADVDAALQQVERKYDPHALQRRALRGNNAARGGRLVDEHDIPVYQPYVDEVVATGASLQNNIHWLNAITVRGTRAQFDAIAKLPFVDRLEPVQRSFHKTGPMNVRELGDLAPATSDGERTLNYGLTQAQLQQINLIALHDAGYTGQGVIIGILDTGFRRDHAAFNNPAKPLHVLAEYDFVDHDGNTAPEPGDPPDQHTHGTMILGCIAAYLPGTLIGGAFDAQFVLAKTEDTTQEVPAEEDNYVAGLQFTEAHGVDMTTSSLGYIDWYTQAQLNGLTAVTTIAMNIHTGNGVHHTNAAGNENHDNNPAISHLIAPADAFQCLTIGAVDSSGAIASFSSDGPTADGRVKPELLARGVTTYTVSPSGASGTTTADGTSLSTPLAASAVACLIQARPWWTVDQMRTHLFATADYATTHGGGFDPLYIRGYGILKAYAAFQSCDNAGTVTLDKARYACNSTLQVRVSDCGLDVNHTAIDTAQIVIASTSEPTGEIVTLTELTPDAAEFTGSLPLGQTDAPGVLLVAPGDNVIATYIDADNGQGGHDIVVTAMAVVDCTPPTISNVQAINVAPHAASIRFTANEPVRARVLYGPGCGQLTGSVELTAMSTNPTVNLTGLMDDSTYYYVVQATDEAGNVATSDNGGACYTFATPPAQDFFTEDFTSPPGNNLDNMSLVWVLNGSLDFYALCRESPTLDFPNDPNDGTTLGFTADDTFKTITLTGGATVKLYTGSYNTLYVGSNGYITFGSGDTDGAPTLIKHFSKPRIAALYEHLSPRVPAARATWKQYADRVVVSFVNVPRVGLSDSNSFQYELFFDGLIKIHYLGIAATGGIAGLSQGLGLSVDFAESDLAGYPSCGPRPPHATSVSAQTPVGVNVDVSLVAYDDGLPNPPGSLSYQIVSLPLHGRLLDPGAGLISAVPYTLVGGGHVVTFDPQGVFQGQTSFTFRASDGGVAPDGGDSNVALALITVGGPQRVYYYPLDTNPGWTTQGLWAWGHPTGASGGIGFDPLSGHTGPNVYGYNLNGGYTNAMPERHLTSTPIDCSHMTQVRVKFWRWLGVERSSYDHAYFRVSNNGLSWATLWHNDDADINESAWSQYEYDISAIADHRPAVLLRWTMGTADGNVTYCGWNIDDIEIWGLVDVLPAGCAGDLNCDGTVDFADIDLFVEALSYPNGAGWPNECPWENGDCNGDNAVDFADIDAFVGLLFTTCP